MKIEINGLYIEDKRDFYQTIGDQMDLPDYFGSNLDALYDVISESDQELTVEFIHYEDLEDHLGSRFLRRLKRMLEDAGVSILSDEEEKE
jgi:ribonuclease inhibitor